MSSPTLSPRRRSTMSEPQYTLYGCHGTASMSIHWLLLELQEREGVNFEYRNIDLGAGEQRAESYLSLNPKGRVPTLVAHSPDGGPDVVVTESGACTLVLCEQHPSAGLRPHRTAPLAVRAKWDETFVFIVNTLLPAMRDWMYAAKDGDGQYAYGVRQLVLSRLQLAFGVLDKQLAKTRFLTTDDRPTALDYLFSQTTVWDTFINNLADSYPNIKRHTVDMRASPSGRMLWQADDIGTMQKKGYNDWEKPFVKLANL